MKLEVIRKEKNLLEVMLIGENHTFTNFLRKTLKKDSHVIYAAYKIEHPLIDKNRPVLKVETDGKETPVEALQKAAQDIKGQMNEFKKQF
ncbi:MAG: DNA-directed RNA polymerase subunit L [Theionarchaea archaeon]|nr:DNA-directed RNA polymerase subunit L [Theionarchaea archaeon]